ncbi:MAG: ribonuclease III domain-containing protein [Alphaproteobacteria bacterium]|nr:ribonuclease III domain-containing protein [Alphaproteobacteria bacterium]
MKKINILIYSLFILNITFGDSLALKESFQLVKENFSQQNEIDFDGLYQNIGYKFKDQTLILSALHPLLPKKLQSSETKNKYEHLEFFGDSVLEIITRELLIDLFPDESRGLLNELRQFLTRNTTLTDIYLTHINIERNLPFPGKDRSTEYCNIIETLIGAIYKDDPKEGFKNAQKFVMRILPNEILHERLEEIAQPKKIAIKSAAAKKAPTSKSITSAKTPEAIEPPQKASLFPKRELDHIQQALLQTIEEHCPPLMTGIINTITQEYNESDIDLIDIVRYKRKIHSRNSKISDILDILTEEIATLNLENSKKEKNIHDIVSEIKENTKVSIIATKSTTSASKIPISKPIKSTTTAAKPITKLKYRKKPTTKASLVQKQPALQSKTLESVKPQSKTQVDKMLTGREKAWISSPSQPTHVNIEVIASKTKASIAAKSTVPAGKTAIASKPTSKAAVATKHQVAKTAIAPKKIVKTPTTSKPAVKAKTASKPAPKKPAEKDTKKQTTPETKKLTSVKRELPER